MILAAVSDIHAPRYLAEFKRTLDSSALSQADALLLAGDIVHNNDHTQVDTVLRLIRSRYGGPVYACFGNNEFDGSERNYFAHGDVCWLWDQKVRLEARGREAYVVGSKGVRDVITPWLVWNTTPNPDPEGTRRIYAERMKTLHRLVSECRGKTTVVLTHFAPCFDTVEGEDAWSPGELGSKKMEHMARTLQPSVWVHGHSHKSTHLSASIGRTRVYNVALPATGRVTIIEV